jgi:hypothetical protein
LSGFTDNFEGPALNPFWSTVTQSGSISLTTAQAHTGKQSVQLSSTETGVQKEIELLHNFSSPTYGVTSVWFYDTGAGADSSNYIGFSISGSNLYASLGTYDYGFAGGGPGRGDQYDYYDQSYTSNSVASGVTRTEAWHQATFNDTAQSLIIQLDGVTIYTRSGGTPFDQVALGMSGPSWRPAWVSYFDDFAFTPYQPDLVTNTNDSGPGSLRQAILNANANNSTPQTIGFNIPTTDPGFANGVFTIQPLSQLPVLSQNITIDGTTQTAYTGNTNLYGPEIVLNGAKQSSGDGLELDDNNTVKGLVVNGFKGTGISMSWSFASGGVSNNNQILGNYVGTDPTGTIAVPNGTGISVVGFASPTVQSSSNLFQGNLVSGNLSNGIGIADAKLTQVLGNLIGTDRTGTARLGNGGNGIGLGNAGAPSNTIQGNTIAFNKNDGIVDAPDYRYSVAYTTSGHQGNAFLQNSIFSNGMLGIDLLAPGTNGNIDAPQGVPLQNTPGGPHQGANLLQNYPVLSSAVSSASNTVVTGTLNSTPSTTFHVEIFANSAKDPTGYGQGQRFLGSLSVTTDTQGNVSFQATLPSVPVGQFLSATATDPGNNTSEFSQDLVVGALSPQVTLSVPSPIAEGQSARVSGTIANPPSQAFQVVLDYGDGSTDTLALAAGSTSFYTEHHYTDESPTGGFTITARINGAVAGTVAVTVTNTPPTVVIGPSSDIALNTSATGFPTPLESDHGWGGGNLPWDIVDGQTTYSEWYHGLAFTGGTANWGGEPAGPRQATIDFGQNQTFDKVVLWHHGDDHIPQQSSLDYWNGSAWVPISFTRTLDIEPGSSNWSRSDTYTFAPVTGSKVRYSFDNRLQNILGTQITHGWLYEFAVGSKTSQITLSGPSLSYSGSFSDPGAHDTFTGLVNYGDGTGDQPLTLNPDRTFALSHKYAAPGTFTVTVKVTDENKGVGTDTLQVVVPRVTPTLAPIADQTVAAGQTLTLTLQGSDPNGQPLTYSATVDSQEYHLRAQLGLYYSGSLWYNWGGKQEKWVYGAGGAQYFILPNGSFYRWDGSNTASGTWIANLPVADYNDPSLLYNAQPGQGQSTIGINGATLTITPSAGFVGQLFVTATVSNGYGTASQSFRLSVIAPPTLAPIADQTISPGQSLTLTLQGSDPAGLPLTYSATVDSQEYHLRAQLGLSYGGSLYYNWGGKNEKWVFGSGGAQYFILPGGAFYRWDGSSRASGTWIADLPVADYNDPSLLYNAQAGQGQAKVSLSGATLTITPNAGFVGVLYITASVSDGYLSASQAFQLAVIATPTLAPIPDQEMGVNQSLTLTLQGSDPAGLPLTYSAIVDTLEHHLRVQLGLYYSGSLYYNWGGKQEKWVSGAGGAQYFILPTGSFYRWDGSDTASGTWIANLPVADYNDPSLLYDAQAGQAQAMVSVSGAQLTITPNADFTGVLYVTAIVSDGRLSASQTFKVTVASLRGGNLAASLF